MEKITLPTLIEDETTIRSQITAALQEQISKEEDYQAQQAFLHNVSKWLTTMLNSVTEFSNRLAENKIRQLERAIIANSIQRDEEQKMKASAPKKQIFSTLEVMEITGIKTKNTIISYFKNGTIKAVQHPRNHRWAVKREDLANYVGNNNF